MQHLVVALPYPQVENKEDRVSLSHEDLVVSTPTSQLPRFSSPDQATFEVFVLEAMDVS
jgi:hypothetical protein